MKTALVCQLFFPHVRRLILGTTVYNAVGSAFFCFLKFFPTDHTYRTNLHTITFSFAKNKIMHNDITQTPPSRISCIPQKTSTFFSGISLNRTQWFLEKKKTHQSFRVGPRFRYTRGTRVIPARSSARETLVPRCGMARALRALHACS